MNHHDKPRFLQGGWCRRRDFKAIRNSIHRRSTGQGSTFASPVLGICPHAAQPGTAALQWRQAHHHHHHHHHSKYTMLLLYIYYIHLQVTTIQKTEKVWAPAPLRSTNMLKNLAIYCEEKSEFASLQFGPFRDPARLVPQRLHVQHWKNLRVSCAAWIFAYDPLWGRHGRFLQDTLDEQTYGICEICLYSHGYVSVSGHDLMFHEDIYWSLWQSSVHQSPDADGNIPISFFTAQSWVPQRDVSLLGPSNQRPPVARSIKWLKIQLKINMDMDQTVNHIKVTRIPQKKTPQSGGRFF